MGKTILVTGANGYIGKYLVKKLLKDGYFVRALVRDLGKMPSWLLGSEKLAVIEGDLQDQKLVKKITKGIDVVYHLAATLRLFEKNGELYKTNILGLKNLLEGCKEAERSLKFIFASSIDARQRSMTDYGQSKLKGEEMIGNFCRENPRVQGIIVRIGNVYGPGKEGMLNGILEMSEWNNWRSSLLYYYLGDKHLYLVSMENLVKKLTELIIEERTEKEILTLVDEKITVKELLKRCQSNGSSKLPKKLPLGQLILKLWQFLGKILQRADLLIYLNLERSSLYLRR